MKKFLIAVFIVCLPLSVAQAREIAVTMYALGNSAIVGHSIGVVVVSETGNGLRMTPHLQNMQAGEFTFTINENVGCHGQFTGIDTFIPGMAAGKALWQMPNIKVTADGFATQPVEIAGVRMTDLSQRSLVISKAPSPTQALAGMQTERIACGSLEHY